MYMHKYIYIYIYIRMYVWMYLCIHTNIYMHTFYVFLSLPLFPCFFLILPVFLLNFQCLSLTLSLSLSLSTCLSLSFYTLRSQYFLSALISDRLSLSLFSDSFFLSFFLFLSVSLSLFLFHCNCHPHSLSISIPVYFSPHSLTIYIYIYIYAQIHTLMDSFIVFIYYILYYFAFGCPNFCFVYFPFPPI